MTFRVEQFEGPLDLLLQLVENEKLDISKVSLAAVAGQFVAHLQESTSIPLEEMADFLVVAAKLIYAKSKILLPSFVDSELEDGPDLETQLRRYQAFVAAAKQIDEMWKSGLCSYPRERPRMSQVRGQFIPPVGVTPTSLAEAMQRVITRLEPIRALPKAAVERVISLQEKIRGLLSRVRQLARMTFQDFVGRRASKADSVVSFLALLELVKQRFVLVTQHDLFHDIEMVPHPEASEADPLAESYV